MKKVYAVWETVPGNPFGAVNGDVSLEEHDREPEIPFEFAGPFEDELEAREWIDAHSWEDEEGWYIG